MVLATAAAASSSRADAASVRPSWTRSPPGASARAKSTCDRSMPSPRFSGVGRSSTLEDDVSSEDRRRLRLKPARLLEEGLEAGVVVMCRVLGHARDLYVDQVQGDIVALLAAEPDTSEPCLQKLSVRRELVPDGQLLGFEQPLELLRLTRPDPDNDRVCLRHRSLLGSAASPPFTVRLRLCVRSP